MDGKLKKEFDYYVSHQKELVKKYKGKYVVIKNCAVVGAYDSELEAVQKSSQKYSLGTFLVQKCEPGRDSYTQTFHSRINFVHPI